MKEHFLNCDTEVTFESVDILASSSLGENTLLTLEALYIKDIRPSINTKDEWKSKALGTRNTVLLVMSTTDHLIS